MDYNICWCVEIGELMLMVSSKQSGPANSSTSERMIQGYSFREQTRREHLLRRLESLRIPIRGSGTPAIDYHAPSRTVFWLDADEVFERVQSVAPPLPNATAYELVRVRAALRSGYSTVRVKRSIIRRTSLDGSSPIFDVATYCTNMQCGWLQSSCYWISNPSTIKLPHRQYTRIILVFLNPLDNVEKITALTIDWLSELLFYNVYSDDTMFSYFYIASLNGSLTSRLYVNYEGYAKFMVSHPFTGYQKINYT